MPISFTERLREPIMRGEITCSVRIWHKPRVKVDGRYPLGDGDVVVTDIREISGKQITAALAKRGGFKSVADLMSVAKHGSGEHIYLVEFRYEPNLDFLPLVHKKISSGRDSAARKTKSAGRRGSPARRG